MSLSGVNNVVRAQSLLGTIYSIAKCPHYESSICYRIIRIRIGFDGGDGGDPADVPLLTVVAMVLPLSFILYLLYKLKISVKVLKATQSFMLGVYYTFVWCVCVFCSLVLAVSMLCSVFSPKNTEEDIVADIGVRILGCINEFIELSVVVFMLHWGSSRSNKQVIIRTAIISGLISLIDNGVEVAITLIYHEDVAWYEGGGRLEIYHAATSALFFLVYVIILFLPLTQFKNKVPERKSFYFYVGFLAFIYCIFALGGLLNYLCIQAGICLNCLGLYLYFSFFGPVLYFCFLHNWFSNEFWLEFNQEVYYSTNHDQYELNE